MQRQQHGYGQQHTHKLKQRKHKNGSKEPREKTKQASKQSNERQKLKKNQHSLFKEIFADKIDNKQNYYFY